MMVVSGNDPVECFFNSINAVKEAFLPLEMGIRKATRDLEHCWLGTIRNNGNGIQLIAQVNEGGKFQIFERKKKKGGECVIVDERKKGLPVNVNLKSFLGVLSQNAGNGNNSNKGEVLKEEEITVCRFSPKLHE